MKLSSLIEKRSEENPVTKAWYEWRKKKWEREAGSHGSDGLRHPSQIAQCPAWMFLKFAGYDLPEEPFSDRSAKIFDNGDAVHERIQIQLAHAGVLDLTMLDETMETPIYHEELQIGGHCDGVLNFGPKRDTGRTVIMFGVVCPVYEFLDPSQRSVLEIKSINQRGWNDVKKKGPKHEHIWQANIYAKVLNISRVSFVYECKDTQEWLEFTEPSSDKSWNEVVVTLNQLDKWLAEFKETGLIPKGVYEQARESAKSRKPWEKVIAQDLLKPPLGQEHLFPLRLKEQPKPKRIKKTKKKTNPLLRKRRVK